MKNNGLKLKNKENENLFFRFKNSKDFKFADTNNYIKHINDTWKDIEYLRFIFFKMHKDFSISKDLNESDMSFSSLGVITKDIYVHMDVIKKLFEVWNKKIISNDFTIFLKKYKNFLNKIRIARNNIIIHKEKDYFYKPLYVEKSTEAYGFYLFKLHLQDNKEGTKKIELTPLIDIQKMEDILKKFEKLNIKS
jgi:hypothetical protein